MTTSLSLHFEQPALWTPASRWTVATAALIVGGALMPYTGMGAEESFNAVFGTVRTWFVPSLATHAEALWGNIKWQSNEVITLPLAVHEMGHLFSVRAKNKPTKQMWIDRFMDTGAASPWPGMHPPSIAKYNVVERFCNAWEGWVLELYAQNANGITPAGDALRSWMDSHMAEWVAVAMGTEVKA